MRFFTREDDSARTPTRVFSFLSGNGADPTRRSRPGNSFSGANPACRASEAHEPAGCTCITIARGSRQSTSGGFNAIGAITSTLVIRHFSARHNAYAQLNRLGAELGESCEETQEWIVHAR